MQVTLCEKKSVPPWRNISALKRKTVVATVLENVNVIQNINVKYKDLATMFNKFKETRSDTKWSLKGRSPKKMLLSHTLMHPSLLFNKCSLRKVCISLIHSLRKKKKKK